MLTVVECHDGFTQVNDYLEKWVSLRQSAILVELDIIFWVIILYYYN